MASIKFKLNKSTQTVKNDYPLTIQILHARSKSIMFTPYHLRKEDYNEQAELALLSCKQSKAEEINSYIAKQRDRLRIIISDLEKRNQPYTAKDILSIYKCGDKGMFLSFIHRLSNELTACNRQSTAQLYMAVSSHLTQFTQRSFVIFSGITEGFVNSFRFYLQNQQLKPNRIQLYLRVFQTIYQKALKEGFQTQAPDPFGDIKLSKHRTLKKAISAHTLRKIATADLPGHPCLVKSRDTFLLSFYMRGMPFVDMAYLQEKNISHNYVCYNRNKTQQPLQVYIEKEMKVILERYRTPGNPYLMSYIDPQKSNSYYTQYRNALRRYNRHLKKIGEILHLDTVLTSYVARHSWATFARDNNIPVSIISESLGHASEEITYTYLASIGQEKIDKSNRKLIKLLGT